MYINSKLESRELIDVLSSLSFADDYREVLRLYDALLPTGEKDYEWEDSLVNFVFDNADTDILTLTGHDIWHALGGIAGVTPAGNFVEHDLSRSARIRAAVDASRFGETVLKRYNKPAVLGVKKVMIGPLIPTNMIQQVLK